MLTKYWCGDGETPAASTTTEAPVAEVKKLQQLQRLL